MRCVAIRHDMSMDIRGLGTRVGKSRLKLNLCQPVAFINSSRFKPAYINKSRLNYQNNLALQICHQLQLHWSLDE